jgi:hypothetical protein
VSAQESLKEVIKHLEFSKGRAYARARAATTAGSWEHLVVLCEAETYGEALAFVEKQLDTVIAAEARKACK